jgi:hypothetical protein
MPITPPFALFVGPTKSGTTWVHAYLKARGDIVLPSGMKETFFFDKVYERGFEWYEGLFPAQGKQQLAVEVAPSLMHKTVACDRAKNHVPFAKIICIARDPLDRAVSHYFHYRKRGAPKCTLREMADTYPDVIEAGLYAQNIARWEARFGPNRVHTLPYDQLRQDPVGFCRRLCDILEIDFIAPDPSLSDREVNAAKLPRNRAAARLAQDVSTRLRRSGAHRIVNALKHTPIKKWLYSDGEDLNTERAEIKKQSVSFAPELAEDWAAFQKRVGPRYSWAPVESARR